MKDQTEGEYTVGLDFNPSSMTAVDEIKRAGANMIDLIIKHCVDPVEGEAQSSDQMYRNSHALRLANLAADYVEIAAMLAVKSITKPLPKAEE